MNASQASQASQRAAEQSAANSARRVQAQAQAQPQAQAQASARRPQQQQADAADVQKQHRLVSSFDRLARIAPEAPEASDSAFADRLRGVILEHIESGRAVPGTAHPDRKMANFMYANVQAITLADFHANLCQCVEWFNRHLRLLSPDEGRYGLCVWSPSNPRKSVNWLNNTVWDMLAHPPHCAVQVDDSGQPSDAATVTSAVKLGVRNLVLFDDASYSGLQVRSVLQGIDAALKHGPAPSARLRVFVCVPYLSSAAQLEDRVFSNLSVVLYPYAVAMPTVTEIAQRVRADDASFEFMIQRVCGGGRQCHLTVFEHKLPDANSTSPYLHRLIKDRGGAAMQGETPYKRSDLDAEPPEPRVLGMFSSAVGGGLPTARHRGRAHVLRTVRGKKRA